MAGFNSVIDYIIDQADRYDINNIQYEKDIIFQITRATDTMVDRILSKVKSDVTSVLDISSLMLNISTVMNGYVSSLNHILMDKFSSYSLKAYSNTDDLIQLGNEVSARFSGKVKEQRSGNNEYDEATIDYIQKHAFELLKNHSNTKIEAIRAEIGNLFLNRRANKANIRSAIERILNVNRSKAEEIAQTELSRAYNYGTMSRLYEYRDITGTSIKKYWHGFKYSESTCEYCRPRIGEIFDLEDESEVLPAHVRCRCVWLPILDGWAEPVKKSLISRANMINTAYNKDMIYQRINTRLGIDYAKYLKDEAAVDYIAGDRTSKVGYELNKARDNYIKDKVDSFGIAKDQSNLHMANEFNQQMAFWKKYVAGAMADNDKDLLNKSYDAIQGVMLLPWNASQMQKWNDILSIINKEVSK